MGSKLNISPGKEKEKDFLERKNYYSHYWGSWSEQSGTFTAV